MGPSTLAKAGLVVGLTAFAGLVTGAVIGLVTDVASRSDISLGNMTLRGNGALIVPVVLLPLAIFTGIVVLIKARVGRTTWFAAPAWPVALVVGLWLAGTSLPALRASAEIGRVNHSATLLSDGRVLVAGGGYDAATAKAIVYDPAADEWIQVAQMNRPRVSHTAVRLSDSRVLIIGGERFDSSPTAEIFDPMSGLWTLVEGPRTIRFVAAAGALSDGRVVAAGGTQEGQATAEIFDPRGGSWRTVGSLSPLRQVMALETSAAGTVLVVGNGEAQAVLVRVDDGVVTPLRSDIGAFIAGAVPLGQGRMLVITGPSHGDGNLAATLITRESKIEMGSPSVRRYDITAVHMADGFVLLAGGNQVGGSPPLGRAVSDAELLDLSTGRWSSVPSMREARTGHSYTNLVDGRVIVIGGASRSGPLATAEIFDPRTRSWTVAAPLR